MFISYKELSATSIRVKRTGRGIIGTRTTPRKASLPMNRAVTRNSSSTSDVVIAATNQAGRTQRIGISAPIIYPSSFFTYYLFISRSEDITRTFDDYLKKA